MKASQTNCGHAQRRSRRMHRVTAGDRIVGRIKAVKPCEGFSGNSRRDGANTVPFSWRYWVFLSFSGRIEPGISISIEPPWEARVVPGSAMRPRQPKSTSTTVTSGRIAGHHTKEALTRISCEMAGWLHKDDH